MASKRKTLLGSEVCYWTVWKSHLSRVRMIARFEVIPPEKHALRLIDKDDEPMLPTESQIVSQPPGDELAAVRKEASVEEQSGSYSPRRRGKRGKRKNRNRNRINVIETDINPIHSRISNLAS